MKTRMFLVAACAGFCALASVARADTVEFTVDSGIFTDNGTPEYINGSGTSSVEFKNNGDTVTLTFSAPSPSTIDLSPMSDGQTTTGISFGTFGVTATGLNSPVTNINDTFTLTLTVIDPALGPGDTTATVTGAIKGDDSGKTIDITLDNFSIPLPGVKPSLDFDFDSITPLAADSGSGDESGSSGLTGSVTYHAGSVALAGIAPLPTSILSGLSLLGLIGVSRIRRHLMA